MAVWPITLPYKFLQQGYSEGDVNNLISNPMDTGPAKFRPKATAGYMPITGQMHISTAQKVVFEDFYKNTIAYGAIPFTMPTYDGGTMESFLSSKKLSFKSGDTWLLSLTLTVLV